MNSKYGDINNTACYNYMARLVDKLFKIIPLKEAHSPTVDTYIEDLIFEISGNKEIFANYCDQDWINFFSKDQQSVNDDKSFNFIVLCLNVSLSPNSLENI